MGFENPYSHKAFPGVPASSKRQTTLQPCLTSGAAHVCRGVGTNSRDLYLGAASRLASRLAAGLRRERLRRKWTQERAAERAELNPRHYQKLEEGTENVTLRTLERLCRAFG